MGSVSNEITDHVATVTVMTRTWTSPSPARLKLPPSCGMSTLVVMGRITNLLKPLGAAFMDRSKSKLGCLSASGRNIFMGFRYPLNNVSVPMYRLGSRLQPSSNCFTLAESSCFRGIRALSSGVSVPSTTQNAAPIRPNETSPVKVLHKAQHHNFPRARAIKRRFKTSTKKLKLVARLVRRARVDSALMQLALSPKKVAKVVRQCIYDAKFNAANNHG
jgi:hypothetical protein